jgi:hypothetical protein
MEVQHSTDCSVLQYKSALNFHIRSRCRIVVAIIVVQNSALKTLVSSLNRGTVDLL